MSNIATLGIEARYGSVTQATSALGRLENQSRRTGRAVQQKTRETTRASDQLRRMGSSIAVLDGPLGGVASRFRSLGTLIGQAGFAAGAMLIAFGSLSLVFRHWLSNTIRQEQAEVMLQQAIRATGREAEVNSQRLIQLAQARQRVTTFGDENTIEALGRMAQFDRISGDMMERAIVVAQDYSAALGVDLVTAANNFGLALQNPTEGLDRLNRQTRAFTQTDRRMIEQMQASGRLLEAQGFILERLEGRVGGAAEALRNTFGGALTALGNAMGDLVEVTGGPLSGLTAIVNAITDNLDALVKAFQIFFAMLITRGVVALVTYSAAKITQIMLIRRKTSAQIEEIRVQIANNQATRAQIAMDYAQTTSMATRTAMRRAHAAALMQETALTNRLAVAQGRAAAAGGFLAGSMRGIGTAFRFIGGPIGVVVGLLSAIWIFRDRIRPVADEVATLGDYFRALGEEAQSAAKHIPNLMERISDMSDSAREFIDSIGSNIVSGLAAILVWTVDQVAKNTETMINTVIDSVNFLIRRLNSLSSTINDIIESGNRIGAVAGLPAAPLIAEIDEMERVTIERGNRFGQNFFEAVLNSLGEGALNAFKGVGVFWELLAPRANQLAALREVEEATHEAANAVQELSREQQNALEAARARIRQQQVEIDQFGMSAVAADVYAFRMGLINDEIARTGVVSGLMMAEINRLTEAYEANANKLEIISRLEAQREAQMQSAIERSQRIREILTDMREPLEVYRDRMQEVNDLLGQYPEHTRAFRRAQREALDDLIRTHEGLSMAREAASTFFGELRRGGSVFDALGSAMNRFLDTLAEQALDTIFRKVGEQFFDMTINAAVDTAHEATKGAAHGQASSAVIGTTMTASGTLVAKEFMASIIGGGATAAAQMAAAISAAGAANSAGSILTKAVAFAGGKSLGGVVMAGQNAIVGERGPERIYSQGNRTAVIPLNNQNQNSSGVTISIASIDAGGMSREEAEQLVFDAGRAAVTEAVRRSDENTDQILKRSFQQPRIR